METIRRINDELAIAGPLPLAQFEQLADDDFRSVLSLRSLEQEQLLNEKRYVEQLGLRYVNMAIDAEVMCLEVAVRVMRQMDDLPKPLLVYCRNSTLAAAMVVMHVALHQGETLSQAFKRAEKFGLFTVAI